jgi:epoxyqueuosine reductase QueG
VEFKRWLAGKKHGEMGYLERNAHKRVEPQLVLPGARSVITLAVSYSQEGRRSKVEGREPDLPASRIPHPTSLDHGNCVRKNSAGAAGLNT